MSRYTRVVNGDATDERASYVQPGLDLRWTARRAVSSSDTAASCDQMYTSCDGFVFGPPVFESFVCVSLFPGL